jgi:hypothetical protein
VPIEVLDLVRLADDELPIRPTADEIRLVPGQFFASIRKIKTGVGNYAFSLYDLRHCKYNKHLPSDKFGETSVYLQLFDVSAMVIREVGLRFGQLSCLVLTHSCRTTGRMTYLLLCSQCPPYHQQGGGQATEHPCHWMLHMANLKIRILRNGLEPELFGEAHQRHSVVHGFHGV